MKIKEEEQGAVTGKVKNLVFSLCKAVGEKVAGEGLGKGATISDDQLAMINKFSLVELTADQVYARKIRLANNAIDRDVERFSEKLLEDFVKTLPGKSLLLGHKRDGTGEGLFFSAEIEKMSLEAARKVTGEELHLPDGMKEIWFLNTWFYTVKLPSLEDFLVKIDAGINRHASIGFSAANFVRIADEDTGDTIYWEYKGPGEGQEGSLVWLGAQRASTTTKGADVGGAHIEEDKQKEKQIKERRKQEMKEFLQKLGKVLGATFVEESWIDDVKVLFAKKDAEIESLKADAANGKAYQKSLVDDTVRFGVLIEEVPADGEKQLAEVEFLKTLPIARLKSQRDKFEALAREKFPSDPMFKGKDEDDRTKDDLKGHEKKPKTGKKDYSTAEDNDLFASIGQV